MNESSEINSPSVQSKIRPASTSNRKSDDKDSLYCDFCHKRRHTRETCFKLNGNPSWYNGKGGRSFGCSSGDSGIHLTDSGDSTQTSPSSVNSTQFPPAQMELMFREFARMWKSKEASNGSSSLANSGNFGSGLSTSCNVESDPWIIDTGATDHMTCKLTLFTTYNHNPGKSHIKTADGSASSMSGDGSV